MQNKDNISSTDKLVNSFLDGSLDASQKLSIQRACRVNSRKDDAWRAIQAQTGMNVKPEAKVISLSSRRFMRYAAILLPFLLIGVVWAGNAIGLFSFDSDSDVKLSSPSISAVNPAVLPVEVIRFEAADINEVTSTLVRVYPQIKGVRGIELTISDSILITTTFDGQPLSEVLEELNLHFSKNFALDSDGFLIISD